MHAAPLKSTPALSLSYVVLVYVAPVPVETSNRADKNAVFLP